MNLLRSILRLVLGKRLPITTGELRVPGLAANATIRRDQHGIPMIEAQSERDAIFALGFCHAQDRAAQLEVLVRLGRGTISEMVGKKALQVDRISRRIGFFHAAQQQWNSLSEANRTVVQAYTDGINGGYSHGLKSRPHEFVLLRTNPTPWEPADVLAYTKLQCWFMASNWDCELARLRILLADGPEALKALDPCFVDDSVITPHSSLLTIDRLEADINALTEIIPLGGGSNNWVIAPKRSETGRPILCNDPHLAAQVPAPWYLVSIRTPEWSVAGASFIGAPAIACGHNGHAAWGVTAGLSDNSDLFIEEIRLEGDTWQYRQGDQWLPCGVRKEVIHPKKGAPVTEEILSTPRGPIISPILNDTPEALSLRAVWLDPLPLDGWLSAMKAKSFSEFREPFREWPGFPMNLVYADISGKTAWQFVGQIPVRKRGHGMLPMAGWDERNGWEQDLVPFDQMPFVEDPEEAVFATANNRPVQKAGGPFLGADWLDPYRHQVIVEELAKREKWDLAGAASIQMCVRSIPWRELQAIILKSDSRVVGKYFEDWDGNISADSFAAAIFELFLAEFAIRVNKAKAEKTWDWSVGKGPSTLNPYSFLGYRRVAHLIDLIKRQPDGWFEQGWAKVIAETLDDAEVDLLQISDIFLKPTWGKLRPLTLSHIMLGRTPLRRVFDLGPVPVSGDEHTPNHASAMPLDPLGPVKSMPNLRASIDVGNWSASRFSIAGGQSGNPCSPHYSDLFELWQRGEGVPIAFTEDEVREATVEKLRLLPV